MLHIKLPSTHQIQGNCVTRQFSTWSTIWIDSWFGPTFQAWFHQGFWVLLWCRLLRAVEQGIYTWGPQYFQVTKWLDQHFLCRMPCLLGLQTSIPSCIVTTEAEYIAMSQAIRDIIPIMGLLQDMREQDFKVLHTSPTCIARSLKTNQVPSNWQGFPIFTLEPSTSTYATIIFANICKRSLSKYSPLTARIRLLRLLPSLWHKMIFNIIMVSCAASDLHKLPKWGSVTYYEILGYLVYRYLRVSPGTTQKCMLHDFCWVLKYPF